MAIRVLDSQVRSVWVDYNGHMNDAEYARLFSRAGEAFIDLIGLDAAGRQQHETTIFTLETHLCYLAAARARQTLAVTADVLDRDDKLIHLFMHMFDDNALLLATCETLLLAVDRQSERAGRLPEAVQTALAAFDLLERGDWPAQASRTVGIRRKSNQI